MTPTLTVSVETLVEVEKWAERARVGNAGRAFSAVMRQIRYNGDDLYNVIHAVTLAQIMPYREIKRYLAIYRTSPIVGDLDLVYDLSEKYQTSRENVVERINHVRLLKSFWATNKNAKKTT